MSTLVGISVPKWPKSVGSHLKSPVYMYPAPPTTPAWSMVTGPEYGVWKVGWPGVFLPSDGPAAEFPPPAASKPFTSLLSGDGARLFVQR